MGEGAACSEGIGEWIGVKGLAIWAWYMLGVFGFSVEWAWQGLKAVGY